MFVLVKLHTYFECEDLVLLVAREDLTVIRDFESTGENVAL